MKIALIGILLLSFTKTCYTQADTLPSKNSRIFIGASTGPNISFGTIVLNNPGYSTYQFSKNINYHAYLTLEIDKNKFEIGPSTGPQLKLDFYNSGYDPEVQNDYNPRINGYHILYLRKVHSKSNWFEHFFKIQFNHIRYKLAGTHIYWDDLGTFQYQQIPYTYKRNTIEGLVGYVFQFNLTPNFYISQSIGLGFYYDHYTIKVGETAGQYPMIGDRTEEDSFFNASMNLNLGYRFSKK